MPVTKHKAFGTSDVMKSEDGNDSLDTIIRQAIGKEPFLSFPRASDSPVQWIQLLHALDQQGICPSLQVQKIVYFEGTLLNSLKWYQFVCI